MNQMYEMLLLYLQILNFLDLFLSSEEDIPTLYPVIPLNPRIHPVNVVEVIPV